MFLSASRRAATPFPRRPRAPPRGPASRGPPDAILGAPRLSGRHGPAQVSVGVGAYRGADGAPCVLPSVRAAEESCCRTDFAPTRYLGITGLPEFSNWRAHDLRRRLRRAQGKDAGHLGHGRAARRRRVHQGVWQRRRRDLHARPDMGQPRRDFQKGRAVPENLPVP